MKKLLTLAIILSSANAFATRARMNALGNSAHLVDVTTVYTNPADLTSHKDSLTLETGTSNIVYVDQSLPAGAVTTDSGAEGLLIHSMGDAKIGFALGHDNDVVFEHRYILQEFYGYAGPETVLTQQNPFSIMYAAKAGEMAWGASLDYSNFQNKTTGAEEKESTMGLNFGARTSSWDAALNILLAGTWEEGTGATKDDMKANTGFGISGGYNVSESLYVYGGLLSAGFKSTIDTAASLNAEQMVMKVGVVSTVKQDANEFFYGVGIENTSLKEKENDIKATTMSLPLIIGLEADAASWLTLRGSVTQKVLIHDEKTTTGATTNTNKAPSDNSTEFAAGAGLKFASVTLDGSILSGGTQTVNSGNLLGQVGLTYNF